MSTGSSAKKGLSYPESPWCEQAMKSIPLQHTIPTPYNVGPVHCYTIELDGEIILFDTGPPTSEAKSYFREHIDLGRLRYILISHSHIDHYGLAHWLEQETGATIYMPRRDCQKISRHEERMEKTYSYLLERGFSKNYLEDLRGVMSSGGVFPPFPEKYVVAEEWVPKHLGFKTLACPGHSQSDLVYTGDDWAVTGDTLLRDIFQSPLLEIDLDTGTRFQSYSAYCESLVRLASLRGRTVLPGHRRDIESIDATLLSYISKLLKRVEHLVPYVGETNVARIIEKMFGRAKLQPFHIYLKLSELLFMIDFLEMPEKLEEALKHAGLFESVSLQFTCVTGR